MKAPVKVGISNIWFESGELEFIGRVDIVPIDYE
jgi:hypothetical protein